MIEKLIENNSILNTVYSSISRGEKITIFGCEKDAKLTLLKESGKSIFFVTSDVKEAVSIKEKFVESGYRVELLMDTLDFKLSPFNNDYNIKVLEVLSNVILKQVDVVVINPMFLLYNLPKYEYLENKLLNIECGQALSVDDLKKALTNMGFSRSDSPQVNEFAIKGDMIDINTHSAGVRVYFDYDEIESIKIYDKETLINISSTDEFIIYPISWFKVDEIDNIKLKNIEQRELVDTYRNKLNNMLWYGQYSDNLTAKLIDYLDDEIIAILDTKATYDYIEEEIKKYNSQIKEEFVCADRFLHKNNIDFKDVAVVGYQYITNQNRLFVSTRVFNIKTIPVSNYVGNMNLLLKDISQMDKRNYTQVLFVKDKNTASNLMELLALNNISFNVCDGVFNVAKNAINIVFKKCGVSINLDVEKVFILSHLNVFGKPKQHDKKNPITQSFNGFLPESGDFVVHTTHGIGKCVGVECLQLSTAKRDYVIIEYKNNDRLYLPVENIDLIDKYIGQPNPTLHKLGGTEFIKAKEKVRNSVKELAFDLKNLYAERNNLKGYVYPKDDELMNEFENSFGYKETADQLQAIEDVKSDMEAGKVMDRLICGDVGFGKTEVAIRGAFKTIISGRQVAFLCPTTILSQQHYNTALYRMKNFGVNIAVLNRFTTPKELTRIYDGISNGEIDLVVGTHKLLNSKVKFKNLGLLILDEEQKFGVGDKEKIKNLKKNINVLTLSATPIPRTLNMSLSGIRDISVIETAPISRIPTKVQVSEYSADLVEQAISNELERDGQVLIVYNKVESIYEYSNTIKKMFPDTNIDVAHGQMEQGQLEKAIFKLYNNETQILISTTLIENGIDLPNANTLIVVNADMLGLSQLYQLKGRVGRADRQAYAYFTYDTNRILTDTALKRLEAITEYSSMGSGFKIALRDLEIRGAGSIFGAEQSGHIEKVGYAMYLKLLSECVDEVKGSLVERKNEVKIETSINAFISNDFISDYNQRMSTYLKISKINSTEKLLKVIESIQEIYGDVPSEVINLCKIALLKNLAEKFGASRVVVKHKQSAIYLREINQNLVNALSNFSEYLVLDNQNQPIITLSKELELAKVVDLLVNFLELMSN